MSTVTKSKRKSNDVVARLRASKAASDAKLFDECFAIGYAWARDIAEAVELQRLDGLHDRLEDDDGWDSFFVVDCECGNCSDCFDEGVAETLHEVIFDAYHDDHPSGHDFFYLHLGRRAENNLAIKAFAEGALNLWAEVEDQI
jgi:hypothetical protein